MKKLLAAILSAALAMSIVSGCASGGGSSSSGGSSSGGESSETQQTGENVTLSFLSWEMIGDAADHRRFPNRISQYQN